jgi:DHA3 family tetracycline resistance protein-like MFS transporter
MLTVIAFAILKVILSAFTIIATRLVEPRLHRPRMNVLVRILWVCSFFLVGLLILFALAGNLWLALTAIVLIGVIREVTYPVYNTWVNHRLEPKYRATVLSISSQMDAVGQIGGGPIVGVVARNRGISTGLLTSGLMLFPILAVLWFQRDSKEDRSGIEEG